jgi:GT2 family glycosyltransferase
MLSIITAIHNQLPVNRLFWANLKRYTATPFELIIIDNASTDGSAEFFESVGAHVIRNPVNYSYPVSQNQGLAVAKGEWLGFLNNDIIVSPDWNLHLIDNMAANGLEVATCCGIEQLETKEASQAIKRRWKRIKGVCSLLGLNDFSLRLMHRWMYRGNWEGFCTDRYQKFKQRAAEGFVGNTVMMTRSALEKLGPWDETMQGADFDLYLRSKKRASEQGDIRPMHIALDTFNHHFIRLTVKAKPPQFADASKLIPLEEKWSAMDMQLLNERLGGH